MKREALLTYLGETKTCKNIFFTFMSREPRKRVARGGKLLSLDAEYTQVYLAFCCVMEKLLILSGKR